MNDQMIVQIIIAVLGSNALIELIKWIGDRIDKKKDSPERKMLRALGEDRLGILLRKWLKSDIRRADEWRIIEALYDGYKALDGNGEIKVLFAEAKEMHITE